MSLFFLALSSVFVTSLFSFVGVFMLALGEERIHRVILYLISFAAGAILGNAFLDLIPHLLKDSSDSYMYNFFFVLLGILLFYVIEAFLHWQHQHHVPHYGRKATYGIVNLVGDGMHNFVDGIVIAASFLISKEVGFTTTLAVILHEIPQEFSDFGILLRAGFSAKQALFFNFLSALTAVLGVIVIFLFKGAIEQYKLLLLAFTAGGFIYIACCDLIPELHKESQALYKSMLQVLCLLLGILTMLALQFIH